MKDIQENELINLCLQGDWKAWETLYQMYYGRIKRIVAWSKWGFAFSEVEDMVQEIFLELVRALPNFRGEASLSTFLTHLSKNKCISLIRKRTAKKRGRDEKTLSLEQERASFDGPQITPALSDPTPSEVVVSREETRFLREALGELNKECQEVIRLRYMEDKPYEEICRILGIPLGTLCSRLKRCLLKLRKMVGKKYA